MVFLYGMDYEVFTVNCLQKTANIINLMLTAFLGELYMSKLKSVTHTGSVFAPSPEFLNQANLTQEKLNELNWKAQTDYTSFWGELALEYITWDKPFTKILNETNTPFYKWFEDGQLNISYNCLDRHVAANPHKTAIIFEADDGHVTMVNYQELLAMVCRFANGLKQIGVKKGERLIIYMPNSIEAVVAMQACARIGAIHSVVFGGFSAKSLAERITDAKAAYVITADAQERGGKTLPLKANVDEALQILGDKSPIKSIIVNKRTQEDCHFEKAQDIWWHNLVKDQPDTCEIELVNSEHPLFILYTSGSTGAPKGVQHSSAGYLLGAILTMQWVFDIKIHSDIFWCTADVGWITGHTYVCYGPLAVGATQIIFEGIPTYPNAGRFWQVIDKHKVSIFYTAPTAIRSLIKIDASLPKQFDLTSLRLLGSVGEPINPEAWLWYYEVIGKKRCPIVDTWWQTETGSHMLSQIPGIDKMKPGSCSGPIPGIMADIVDESGNLVKPNNNGYLVIKRPFPSQIRTIWNNPELFIKSYFPKYIANGKYYVAGDSAYLDSEERFWILGRIDDVLNVSGHRLSTMEIESALTLHPQVAEAAIVSKLHDIKGESIFAFVVCKGTACPVGDKAHELSKELVKWIIKEIGPIAKPDEIRFSNSLPKTRSGKIMRRLLRSIARNEEITQDISTLENPAILEQLKKEV
ncbi:MAG: acetate--CoA ligase [Burkholderiales bacterium]|jgi:acetyl-CoA synthetase|nr:acetate--CoA ligase [Burkholderiales bacterium]